MKAVIYARYSSINQSEMSIDDQISLCKARAKQQGWDIVRTFSDSAISGSTPLNMRSGGAALLSMADSVGFDLLLLESLDRLSRDQVEQEQVVRRLEYRGVRIVGVCDGYDSNLASRKVLRSVRGLVNELYLDDLRLKTHRGLSGQVTRGYSAGGKSYGYDLIKEADGSRYEINDKEAQWVRYIFDEYSKGASVQTIVKTLNRLAVPSPRSGTWAVSALYGSPVKWSGILNNRLYIGKLIWNRSKWVKDPDTGRRKRIDRPQHEWLFKDVPELRIVDDKTWQKVRLRIDGGRDADGRKRYVKPSKTLLGGLLSCPYCGGTMIAVNQRSYGCINNKDRGVCRGFLVKKSLIESRLVDYVKTQLLTEDSIRVFEEEFKRMMSKHINNAGDENLRDRLIAINGRIDKLVEALTQLGHSDALLSKLQQLEEEKSHVMNRFAREGTPRVEPNIKEMFYEALDDLEEFLGEDKQKAQSLLKGLFGKIQIVDNNNGEILAKIDKGRVLNLLLKPVYTGGCEGRI